VFTLALRRRFEAQHHLIGGDWGAENEPHTHTYLLELRLEGAELDQHGYLVDLIDVEHHLDTVLQNYRGADLNELPEFAGLNPSLEHFARILARTFSARLAKSNLKALTTQLWENENAWASYRLEF
jgi:6-pyruvoyltetrahydropterin/6-carboxytetrahydropterin synthase